MMPEKAIYEKYHRKMKELLKTCDMEGFLFVPDEIFDKFSTYFLKTVEKEAAFNLYRYTGLKRLDSDSDKRVFSFDTDNLYLSKNGSQNDIFEGIAQTDYSFTSIEECIKEWRICDMNYDESVSGKNIEFPYITKIFLGPRIEPENKKKVLAAVKVYNEKGKEQIVVYTTKLLENTYDIEFKEYDWEARE